MEEKLITILECSENAQADIICMILRSEEIEYFISGEYGASTWYVAGLPIRIQVKDADVQRTRKLLSDILKSQSLENIKMV